MCAKVGVRMSFANNAKRTRTGIGIDDDEREAGAVDVTRGRFLIRAIQRRGQRRDRLRGNGDQKHNEEKGESTQITHDHPP